MDAIEKIVEPASSVGRYTQVFSVVRENEASDTPSCDDRAGGCGGNGLRTDAEGTAPIPLAQLKEQYTKKRMPSVGHGKFPQLQRAFARPQEVTSACIECHNGRHIEAMRSNHWSWGREQYIEGCGVSGRKNAVNNFCLAAEGNELACAKCHVG